ncbi:MAG TPA: hypothetical protein VFE42_05510 [Chloroflexota bacterium]|nr:hypothetical protein [Chloroflexota bacterium]
MRPAVFTDEIDLDATAAIRVCAEEGVRAVQLRQVGRRGRNVVALPDDEIRALLAELRHNGVRVAGIGSPFGKCDLFDDAAYRQHLALRLFRANMFPVGRRCSHGSTALKASSPRAYYDREQEWAVCGTAARKPRTEVRGGSSLAKRWASARLRAT